MLWVEVKTGKVRQVLEGRYKDLVILYEKIRSDPRHTELEIEERKFVLQRSFRNWSVMTLVVTSELVLPKKETESKILQVEYTSMLKNIDDVEPILAFAKAKNETLNVGGMMWLFLKTGRVRQALEGPEDVVMELLEKIEKDDRHTKFKVLHRIFTEKRKYSRWEARTCQETSSLRVALEA
mmetsp:Transcript_7477/g.10526  ORF Transcript_7477/g.10526 Transcript_7477/m.10526 type:complete len:181 (-) Transcript_7477:163-705(-)